MILRIYTLASCAEYNYYVSHTRGTRTPPLHQGIHRKGTRIGGQATSAQENLTGRKVDCQSCAFSRKRGTACGEGLTEEKAGTFENSQYCRATGLREVISTFYHIQKERMLL